MLKLTRSEPEKSLPPDLVMTFTTPPVKRPYSAEIPDVEAVVSEIASSMKRFNGPPRRFSLITTPLISQRFSKDMAPEMEICLDPSDRRGPV